MSCCIVDILGDDVNFLSGFVNCMQRFRSNPDRGSTNSSPLLRTDKKLVKFQETTESKTNWQWDSCRVLAFQC